LLVDLGWQSPGQTFTIEARGIELTADPVLRIWSPEEGELAWDDDGGFGNNARIDFSTARWTHLIIMMHAAHAWSRGHASFWFGGFNYGSQPLGGRFINVPCGSLNDIHAVAQPFGPAQIQLYGFDSRLAHLVAFNAMGGTGGDALIARRTDVCSVMIGRAYYRSAPSGTVTLYVNDIGLDRDHDRLGASLESALGTCDIPAASGGCAGVIDGVDTDHDGLTDADELLGYEFVTSPHESQNLPAWGANPMHKDSFIEVDWTGPEGSSTIIRANDVAHAVSYFTSSGTWPDLVGATGTEASNPDGRDGIALHYDIGQPTPPGRFDMPYGDWGGGGERLPPGTNYRSIYGSAMRPIRQIAFRHGLATPSGAGQAPLGGLTLTYNSSAAGAFRTLAHETGHTLGLSHYGISEWGPVNCKPTYLSIMNYAYGGFGFSHENGTGVILDPSALGESRGMYPEASSLMNAPPWSFEINSQGGIDWNRDGHFDAEWTPCWFGLGGCTSNTDPSHRVKAPVAQNTAYNDCGTFANSAKRQTLMRLPSKTSAPTVSPTEVVLLNLGGWLYAIWMDVAQERLHYRSARLGRPEWDDCRQLADGTRGDRIAVDGGPSPGCLEWMPERSFPLPHGRNLSALTWRNTGYLAWDTGYSGFVRRLVSGTDGSLGFAPQGSFGYSASGQLLGSSTLALVHVDPERHHGLTEVLAIFYRPDSETTGAWMWSEDGVSWHQKGMISDAIHAPIPHSGPPAFASIPGGQTCGVFPIAEAGLTTTNPRLEFYCFDESTETWVSSHPPGTTYVTGTPTPAFGRSVLWTGKHRPSLAYHVFRDEHGRPVHGDPTEGQFVLSYVQRAGASATRNLDVAPALFFSTPVNASSDPATQVQFPYSQHHYFANSDARTWRGTGVTLLEGPSLNSLKGAWVNGNRLEDDFKGINFYPSVDGTYQVLLQSGNDFVEIEKRMCTPLGAQRDHFFHGFIQSNGAFVPPVMDVHQTTTTADVRCASTISGANQ